MPLVLKPSEKIDVAAQIESIRCALLISSHDDVFTEAERKWFQDCIPALDAIGDTFASVGKLELLDVQSSAF